MDCFYNLLQKMDHSYCLFRITKRNKEMRIENEVIIIHTL